MKKYYILGFLIILAGAVYYTGVYTYFQNKEVNEFFESPTVSPELGAGDEAKATPGRNIVVEGQFVEVDFIHRGSGTARIVEEGGKRYLQLEDFNVTNGPDLYVYLSESKSPSNDLKSLDKYISLGFLKGNIGNQIYEIPDVFRGYDTAIIWCQKFGVLFSYAVME